MKTVSIVRPPFLIDSLLAAQIVALDCDSLTPYWSEESWRQVLEGPKSGNYTLFMMTSTDSSPNRERLQGFCLWQQFAETWHLLKIAVAASERRQGVGQMLWQQSMASIPAEVEDLFLEVAAENTSAVRFYEQLGFEWAGVAKNFYGPGLHGLRGILRR